MPRPKKVPGQRPTRDRILDEASRAFARNDFAQVKLADVAKKVGISRPSLLYHFNSKIELYEAVIGKNFEELAHFLTQAMTPMTPAELVETFVSRFSAFLVEKPDFARLFLRELLDDRSHRKNKTIEETDRIVSMICQALRDTGETPEKIRSIVLQIGSALLMRAAMMPGGERLWGDPDHQNSKALALRLFGFDPLQ